MAASPKTLTESDVKSRLYIPSEWWNMISPLFGEEEGQGEVDLQVVDGVGLSWEFRCAARTGRYKKPVLQSDGWLQFVNYKGLSAGDRIVLEAVENQFRGTRFMLRALKYDAAGRHWFDV